MENIKQSVVKLLNRALVAYLRRGDVKVIAVAGSIGKTSTAKALRTVLSQKYRVHMPVTAYNTNKSVHLEVFNLRFASSLSGWLWAVLQVLGKSLGKPDFQVLVVEIGTDHPGEMAAFAFLRPHIGVLTAIAPEHMEHFKTIEAVAEEELAIASYCDKLVMNKSAVEQRFVPQAVAAAAVWYGAGTAYAAARYKLDKLAATKTTADLQLGPHALPRQELHVIGEHSLQALLAAGAVGDMMGLSAAELAAGLAGCRPAAGRMQLLDGAGGSVIIDDSYNSSPEAAKAALQVLYGLQAPQRIAIMGSMNEMGDYSAKAHREVGGVCDPLRLDLLVTIGDDAGWYLATEALRRGCTVKSFSSPYEAGAFVRQAMKPGAAILVKGSQNRVFAEESVKLLLANPDDAARLVRQSDYWLRRKRQQFGPPPGTPS